MRGRPATPGGQRQKQSVAKDNALSGARVLPDIRALGENAADVPKKLASPAGFEPATPGLGIRRKDVHCVLWLLAHTKSPTFVPLFLFLWHLVLLWWLSSWLSNETVPPPPSPLVRGRCWPQLYPAGQAVFYGVLVFPPPAPAMSAFRPKADVTTAWVERPLIAISGSSLPLKLCYLKG